MSVRLAHGCIHSTWYEADRRRSKNTCEEKKGGKGTEASEPLSFHV